MSTPATLTHGARVSVTATPTRDAFDGTVFGEVIDHPTRGALLKVRSEATRGIYLCRLEDVRPFGTPKADPSTSDPKRPVKQTTTKREPALAQRTAAEPDRIVRPKREDYPDESAWRLAARAYREALTARRRP